MKETFIEKNFRRATLATIEQANAYIEQYGAHSWELDALDPRVIESLIEAKVEQYRDPIAWEMMVEREQVIQSELSLVQQQLEQRGI